MRSGLPSNIHYHHSHYRTLALQFYSYKWENTLQGSRHFVSHNDYPTNIHHSHIRYRSISGSFALSLLAQVRAACGGDLDRLKRVVKLTGFVNSTADFTDQPKVINGASDFMVEALGDAGRHARSAVSAASLPLGVAVEIEGIFEIE